LLESTLLPFGNIRVKNVLLCSVNSSAWEWTSLLAADSLIEHISVGVSAERIRLWVTCEWIPIHVMKVKDVAGDLGN